jgi:hypothetical protein
MRLPSNGSRHRKQIAGGRPTSGPCPSCRAIHQSHVNPLDDVVALDPPRSPKHSHRRSIPSCDNRVRARSAALGLRIGAHSRHPGLVCRQRARRRVVVLGEERREVRLRVLQASFANTGHATTELQLHPTALKGQDTRPPRARRRLTLGSVVPMSRDFRDGREPLRRHFPNAGPTDCPGFLGAPPAIPAE